MAAGLAGASVAVVVHPRLRRQPRLRDQVLSWWLLLPFMAAAVGLGQWGPPALAALILGLAWRELVHLAGDPALSRAWPRWLCLAWLGLWPAMLSLLAWPLLFQAHLDAAPAWALYLLGLTALNDVAQFISGSLWGRHRLAPRVSPHKTWQGLAGGVAVSMGLSVAVGASLGLAPVPVLCALGAWLALAGVGGDLYYSAIKRRLGIKDFSRLIPGHGGLLDRVDSLAGTAPTLVAWLVWSIP